MACHIEIKALSAPRFEAVINNAFAGPTLTVTPGSSWAIAATAGQIEGSLETYHATRYVIISNDGDTSVAAAFDAAEDPAAFHVIQAGTQRQISVTSGLPLKLRALA